MERLLIPYSKTAAIWNCVILFGITFYLFPSFIYNLYHNHKQGWILIAFMEIGLFSLTTGIFIRRLIPSLKKDTALELNETGIYDHVSNVKVDWKDVVSVKIKTGRTLSLIIGVKNPVIGSVIIPLKWVTGYYEDILYSVEQFWNRYKQMTTKG